MKYLVIPNNSPPSREARTLPLSGLWGIEAGRIFPDSSSGDHDDASARLLCVTIVII